MTNHFSMRLTESQRIWLRSQSRRLNLPMTKTIMRLFSLHTDIPNRHVTAILAVGKITITGEIWDGLFTGLVRVQLVGDWTASAIELQLKDQTMIELEHSLQSFT